MACSFVSTRDYAGCAVLALRGDLDISDRAELSSQLTAVVSCGPWVIVDLTNLAYMDCGSLGLLAAVRERAQLAGGDVLLAGPRGAVAWMLLLTGRAREFSVFPSVGVAAFGAGLAAIGTRLATDGAGKSLAAATEKMVTAAGTVMAPLDLGDGAGPAAASNGDWTRFVSAASGRNADLEKLNPLGPDPARLIGRGRTHAGCRAGYQRM